MAESTRENLLGVLKEVLATKRDLNGITRFLRGELGGFKAEVYNHFHALENRVDNLSEELKSQANRIGTLADDVVELRTRLDFIERRLDETQSKLRHLDSSILFLIVLNILILLLVAVLLFRVFTMP